MTLPRFNLARRHLTRFTLHLVPERFQDGLVRRLVPRAGFPEPTAALADLSRTLGEDKAINLLFDDEPPDAAIWARLFDEEYGEVAVPYVMSATLQAAKREPLEAKKRVLAALLAGNRSLACYLLPEVASYLDAVEAVQVFELLARDALQPIDPYAPSGQGGPAAALAAVIALYPDLVGRLITRAGSDPTVGGIAGDIVLLAMAHRRTVTAVKHLPAIVAVLAENVELVPERVRTADSRYSIVDHARPSTRPRRGPLSNLRRRFGGLGFRVVALLLADGLAIVSGSEVVSRLDLAVVRLGAGEAFAALAVLVAVHVVAVELAAVKLPGGFLSRVGWPARMISAYSVATVWLIAGLLPTDLRDLSEPVSVMSATLFLAHLPAILIDLVGKSDRRRAAKRAFADRAHDMATAGRASANTHRALKAFQDRERSWKHIRRSLSEPVRHRRVAIRAARAGFIAFDLDRLDALDSSLDGLAVSALAGFGSSPSLALLVQPGHEVAEGDLVATLEADEPDLIESLSPQIRLAIHYAAQPAVQHAKELIRNLGAVMELQVAERDISGAQMTSDRIASSLRTFLLEADTILGREDPPKGYLETALPMSPELDAVRSLEMGLRASLASMNDESVAELASHAVRLAHLRAATPYAATLDYSVARLSITASGAEDDGLHTIAALIVDLGRIAAEWADRSSFAQVRLAMQDITWISRTTKARAKSRGHRSAEIRGTARLRNRQRLLL